MASPTSRARGHRVLFLELKSAKGDTTANQRTWGDVLSGVGGNVEYHLFRPADWPEIVDTLLADAKEK